MSATGNAPSPLHAERRRSPHLLRDVALMVYGESPEHKPFEEETFSISISVHGVLILLANKVEVGQRLVLKNPATQSEVEGHVARFGSPYGGLAQVGVEFAQPTPEFWQPEQLH